MWLRWSTFLVVIVGVLGQVIEDVLPPEQGPVEVIFPPENYTEPTVVISQGTVVGSTAGNGSYIQFFGIPYADSTAGRNRFKAPNPPPSFQDTFIANRKNIKCVRGLGTGYEGTEDCLVANIFTPNLSNNRNMPVMVWVKGKEFNKAYENEPSFENFVTQDIVVVTLNYRESVLGFLCLGTETAPGNAGLKDIIAGLQWIQENIAQFGGNPNDVALVGHGTGAAAIDLITLSPMSNGLIHKAIAQSGNALSPWAVTRDNLKYAVQVAESLGHTITNIEDLSEIFQRTSVAALMAVINELDLTDNSLAFAPCVERENLTNVKPFMTKSPYQILTSRDFVQIPIIMGFVDNEGTIRSEEALEDDWLSRMNDSFIDFLQPDLMFENDENRTQIAKSVRSFYFTNNPIDLQNIQNYIDYHGDTMILISTLREMRQRAIRSIVPLYLYQFSYKGSLGEPYVGPIPVNSAAHSEELAYMFYDANDEEIPIRDRSIGDLLIERWTWFVKMGQPLSGTSRVFWQPYTAIESAYLRVLDNEEINEQSSLEISLLNPHPEAVNFWDQIYEEHFLDADAKWDLTERIEEEEEDDNNEVTTTIAPVTEEDTDDNSASSPIGYTFSIIALFAILNKVHTF